MTNSLDQDQIQKIVELAAPIIKVWRALTDHKEFGKWFQVRLDGPFQTGVTTTGSMTAPGHEHVKWVSVTEQIDPKHLFAFSWPPSAVDPVTQYSADAKIYVEFRLMRTGTGSSPGTRLTITESGFQLFPETKRLEILRSNAEGWDIQAQNIAAYVQ